MAWYLMFEIGECNDSLRDRTFYTASGTEEEVYQKILKHKNSPDVVTLRDGSTHTHPNPHPWTMEDVKDMFGVMFMSDTEIVEPSSDHWMYYNIRLG